jgi:hypothetical protein
MTSLNLSSNALGGLVLPAGWISVWGAQNFPIYKHSDGREQKEHPGEPEGIIAVANAIKDMGAMTSLNLSSSGLTRGGALKRDDRGWDSKRAGIQWGSIDGHYESDMQGVIALANAIPGMQVLNVSSNALGSSGITALCAAIRCGLCHAVNAVLQVPTCYRKFKVIISILAYL